MLQAMFRMESKIKFEKFQKVNAGIFDHVLDIKCSRHQNLGQQKYLHT